VAPCRIGGAARFFRAGPGRLGKASTGLGGFARRLGADAQPLRSATALLGGYASALASFGLAIAGGPAARASTPNT
jgi:hypothetical protein